MYFIPNNVLYNLALATSSARGQRSYGGTGRAGKERRRQGERDGAAGAEGGGAEEGGPVRLGPHGQGRRLAEDYVALIADLLDREGAAWPAGIARRLGVSQITMCKAIGRPKRKGLAHARPYRGVYPTEEGQDLARRVHARHRTVVVLLKVVGVAPQVAEADAEGIEHHVSDAALEVFERFLQLDFPHSRGHGRGLSG